MSFQDRFIDLGSDVNWEDYGSLHAIQDKSDKDQWYAVRFENCEEWGDGAKGYYVEVLHICLDVKPETLESALDCCGMKLENDLVNDNGNLLDKKASMRAKVYALISYGYYDQHDYQSSLTGPKKLRNNAFKYALTSAGYKP